MAANKSQSRPQNPLPDAEDHSRPLPHLDRPAISCRSSIDRLSALKAIDPAHWLRYKLNDPDTVARALNW